MFCGKINLKKLQKLQEQALATVFCDNSLTYEDMLEKSGQLRILFNLTRLVAIDSDSDSDKVYSTTYIQVPYQVYMGFLEIQITL